MKREKKSALKRLREEWKEWIPEIFAILILVFTLIWLVIPNQGQSWLYSLLKESILTFLSELKRIQLTLYDPSTLIGLAIVIIIIFLAVMRVRYHVKRNAISSKICPFCSNKMYQRHRHFKHRLLSLIIPVRRYYCPICGWKGLKVSKRKLERKK